VIVSEANATVGGVEPIHGRAKPADTSVRAVNSYGASCEALFRLLRSWVAYWDEPPVMLRWSHLAKRVGANGCLSVSFTSFVDAVAANAHLERGALLLAGVAEVQKVFG
jgi:hypothetical protein